MLGKLAEHSTQNSLMASWRGKRGLTRTTVPSPWSVAAVPAQPRTTVATPVVGSTSTTYMSSASASTMAPAAITAWALAARGTSISVSSRSPRTKLTSDRPAPPTLASTESITAP